MKVLHPSLLPAATNKAMISPGSTELALDAPEDAEAERETRLVVPKWLNLVFSMHVNQYRRLIHVHRVCSIDKICELIDYSERKNMDLFLF